MGDIWFWVQQAAVMRSVGGGQSVLVQQAAFMRSVRGGGQSDRGSPAARRAPSCSVPRPQVRRCSIGQHEFFPQLALLRDTAD